MNGLIGYTGFVGSNINNQASFDLLYNSKNIAEIDGESFDLLVCAGVSGVKWKANKFPRDDLRQINKLLGHLRKTNFKKLVLISTIAVYQNPADNAYGRNRLYFETCLRDEFPSTTIIRLPGLFGENLKKNAIYDMINKKYEYLPNLKSSVQYYCLDNLWKDITIALKNEILTLNISPEPVSFDKICSLFGLQNYNSLSAPLVKENMVTRHANFWGKKGNYTHSAEEIMLDLQNFIKKEYKEC